MQSPSREKIEKVVIGSMLLESRAIDYLSTIGAKPTWFLGKNERKAATAMLMRYESGKVANNPIAIEQDTEIPGVWFDSCIDAVPSVAHIEYYADLLKGHSEIDSLSVMRSKIEAAIKRAKPEDAAILKSEIEAALHDAIMDTSGGIITLKQAAHEWIDKVTDRSKTTLLDWPIPKITKSIGRIDSELVWIIAQPSVGKTAFCCQWASRLAKAGHITTLFSLESSVHSLVARFLMEQGNINVSLLKDQHPSDEEIEKAKKAADKLSDLIRVIDKPMTIDQLYAMARAEKRRGSKLIMIDNTRHIRVPRISDRIQKMEHICTRVKQLRDDTRMPVVVLHHSNKDDDVSWSSDVRRDADILAFLRNVDDGSIDRTDGPPSLVADVSFDVEKHREGTKDVGVVMEYDKKAQRFTGKQNQRFEEWNR